MARVKTIRLEVKNAAEGEAIQRAMSDPETRAFVVVFGTLLPFSDRARKRVLDFVSDFASDPESSLRLQMATEDDATATGEIYLP